MQTPTNPSLPTRPAECRRRRRSDYVASQVEFIVAHGVQARRREDAVVSALRTEVFKAATREARAEYRAELQAQRGLKKSKAHCRNIGRDVEARPLAAPGSVRAVASADQASLASWAPQSPRFSRGASAEGNSLRTGIAR